MNILLLRESKWVGISYDCGIRWPSFFSPLYQRQKCDFSQTKSPCENYCLVLVVDSWRSLCPVPATLSWSLGPPGEMDLGSHSQMRKSLWKSRFKEGMFEHSTGAKIYMFRHIGMGKKTARLCLFHLSLKAVQPRAKWDILGCDFLCRDRERAGEWVPDFCSCTGWCKKDSFFCHRIYNTK